MLEERGEGEGSVSDCWSRYHITPVLFVDNVPQFLTISPIGDLVLQITSKPQ
jgi:hypothetical protein